MAEHLIVRGGGAAKWVSFARAQLKNLRETLGLYAFTRSLRVAGASIRLKWAGEEEWIYIVGVGFIIMGWARSDDLHDHQRLIRMRYLQGGAVVRDYLPETTDNYFITGPAYISPLGDGSLLIVIGQFPPPFGDITFHTYILGTNGVVRRLPINFTPVDNGVEGYMHPAYGGPVFDEDGNIVGNRCLLWVDAPDLTGQKLWRSNNSGKTWFITAMNVSPPDPPGTRGHFRQPVSIGRNKLLSIRRIPDDPDNPAVTTQFLIIRSTDGGESWSTLPATGLSAHLNPAGEFSTVEINWRGDFVVLGKDKVMFLAITHSETERRSYTSTNGGETWSAHSVAAEGSLAVAIWSVPLAIGNDAVVFRYTPHRFSPEDGDTCIVRTLDSGATWEHLPGIVPGKPHDEFGVPTLFSRGPVDPISGEEDQAKAVLIMPIFDAGDPPDIPSGTYLYVSRDSGETWQKGALIVEGGELGTVRNFFHLGTTSRPKPANIGATGLYSAD